jgi:MoaA/NifB/PqqE/SkfB family radical SAM enzyme
VTDGDGMKVGGSLRLGLEIARSAWLRDRPFLLYYKPTARCDARCAICDRWRNARPASEELPLETVTPLLERFRRAGAAVLTLWGGEPLLRVDLPEILAAAHRLGYRTSMCTNARELERRAADVVPHLDTLLCSLDGHGAVHDRMRGVEGMFERVLRGLRAAKAHRGCDVKIWASLHRESVGQVEQLADLAGELGAGIEFFPLSPIPGYNDALRLSPTELRDAIARVRARKRAGAPVRNPDRALELLARGEAFECNFGRIAISMDHVGHIYTCEDPQGTPLAPWGTHRDFDPEAVFRSPEYRAARARLRSCNRCRLPCVTELAGSLPLALAGMAASRARR